MGSEARGVSLLDDGEIRLTGIQLTGQYSQWGRKLAGFCYRRHTGRIRTEMAQDDKIGHVSNLPKSFQKEIARDLIKDGALAMGSEARGVLLLYRNGDRWGNRTRVPFPHVSEKRGMRKFGLPRIFPSLFIAPGVKQDGEI